MIDIDTITSTHGSALRAAVTKFFVPLQTTRVVKREAFEELSHATKALAKALKSHALVPKSLLNEIYGSIQILRNEAPYFREETSVLEDMANQLEMTLGLILLGESQEDRAPGTPRII